MTNYDGFLPPTLARGTGNLRAQTERLIRELQNRIQEMEQGINFYLRGDLISENWDGAEPADLSSDIDTTATEGFYFDSSEGSFQAIGDAYFVYPPFNKYLKISSAGMTFYDDDSASNGSLTFDSGGLVIKPPHADDSTYTTVPYIELDSDDSSAAVHIYTATQSGSTAHNQVLTVSALEEVDNEVLLVTSGYSGTPSYDLLKLDGISGWTGDFIHAEKGTTTLYRLTNDGEHHFYNPEDEVVGGVIRVYPLSGREIFQVSGGQLDSGDPVIQLYGQSDTSYPGDLAFYTGGSLQLQYDDSSDLWSIRAGGSEKVRISTSQFAVSTYTSLGTASWPSSGRPWSTSHILVPDAGLALGSHGSYRIGFDFNFYRHASGYQQLAINGWDEWASIYMDANGINFAVQNGTFSSAPPQFRWLMGINHIGNTTAGVSTSNTTNRVAIGTYAGSGAVIQTHRTSNVSLYVGRDGTSGGAVSFRWSTSQVGYISLNGSSTTYGTTSDYRLKDNVQDYDLEDAHRRIMDLRLREWDWVTDGSRGVGFVAQEAYPQVPNAVDIPLNDDDTNPEGYWAVDYGKITPWLVGAAQHQEKQIVKQGKRIRQLETRIEELEEQWSRR